MKRRYFSEVVSLKRKSLYDFLFEALIYFFIVLLSILCIVPIWNVFVISITPASALKLGFSFWPKKVDFGAWGTIFRSSYMWRSFYNTVVRTVVGTLISIVLTILVAYPLSKKRFPFRNFFMLVISFTMLFSGGLIPSFLVIKKMHMIDTLWSLVLPSAVSAFNVIVLRSFFKGIPDSLEESAIIDGANDWIILLRIYLPLSLAGIATIALWLAVDNWNAWFDVVLYINDRNKNVLQIDRKSVV